MQIVLKINPYQFLTTLFIDTPWLRRKLRINPMLTHLSWILDPNNWWIVFGFAGQFLFSMRFLYQWIASEKAKKSVIPDVFWYFSLSGGLVLFVYAVHKEDPVFILGQGLGVFIYLRNIYFIWQHKRTQNA